MRKCNKCNGNALPYANVCRDHASKELLGMIITDINDKLNDLMRDFRVLHESVQKHGVKIVEINDDDMPF